MLQPEKTSCCVKVAHLVQYGKHIFQNKSLLWTIRNLEMLLGVKQQVPKAIKFNLELNTFSCYSVMQGTLLYLYNNANHKAHNYGWRITVMILR